MQVYVQDILGRELFPRKAHRASGLCLLLKGSELDGMSWSLLWNGLLTPPPAQLPAKPAPATLAPRASRPPPGGLAASLPRHLPAVLRSTAWAVHPRQLWRRRDPARRWAPALVSKAEFQQRLASLPGTQCFPPRSAKRRCAGTSPRHSSRQGRKPSHRCCLIAKHPLFFDDGDKCSNVSTCLSFLTRTDGR
jgi:hypothetical protein